MIQIETRKNVIYTTAKNKLNEDDYDQLIPILKEKVGEFKEIRWYFEMQDFEGWTPTAAWEDVKFDFKNLSNFKKVAMVGSKKWEDWLTQLMKPFTSAEVKFFETAEKEKAKAWIAY